MTPATHALGAVVEDRIAELIGRRFWYRTTLSWAAPSLKPVYSSMYREWTIELRSLLALRRRARNIARAAEVARTAEQDRRMATYMDRHGGYEGLSDEMELGMI